LAPNVAIAELTVSVIYTVQPNIIALLMGNDVASILILTTPRTS